MGRVLIAPNQHMSKTEVQIYPTFFMIILHNKGAGERGYNFKTAKNNDSRTEGGLRALDKLYTPINMNSA